MIVQKYLGWLQRYLYAIEQGPIPIPAPVIEVGNEPFEWFTVRGEITTIVGNATLDFTTPENKRRLHVWAVITGAPAFTAGDDIQLSVLKAGLTYPVSQINNLTANQVNGPASLIGTAFQDSTAGLTQNGCRPVYVGPGETLRVILQGSVAGLVGTYRGLAIEVPSYAPFPNVF